MLKNLGSVDGGVASLSWGYHSSSSTWDIYFAPGTKSVKVPVLPDDAAAARPVINPMSGNLADATLL